MVVLHTSPRRGEILSSSSSSRDIYTSLKTIRGAESIYATTARRPDSKEGKWPQQELKGKSSISAPVEKQEEGSTSEYALPRPAKRESENQYAPLCLASQNKPQDKEDLKMGDSGSNSENNSPNSLPNISTSHSPSGYDSNNTSAVGVTEEYRGKELCLSHWKVFLAVAVIVSVVLVVVVLLLGIAAAGLSGSSENTERYRELEEAALGMAGLIERLETQLNSSTSALNELRYECETFNQKTEFEISRQRDYINTRLEEGNKSITVLRNQWTLLNSNISELQWSMKKLNLSLQNKTATTDKAIADFRNSVTSSLEDLNDSLLTEITDRMEEAKLMTQNDISMLTSAVEKAKKSIVFLNGNVTRLSGLHTIPTNCTSVVYKNMIENSTETHLRINKVSKDS